MTKNIHKLLVDEAKGLLEPGEELLNPEYTRALVELIARFAAVSYEEAAKRIGVDYAEVHKACSAATEPKRYINVQQCFVKYPSEAQDALGGKDFGKILEESNLDISGVTIEVTTPGPVVKIRSQTPDEQWPLKNLPE